MARTALYRHYDKDGVLLYVGISMRVMERLSQHTQDTNRSYWFDQIAIQTIEWFETRAEAIEAERWAIINEKPLYNKQHQPENGNKRSTLPEADEERPLFNIREYPFDEILRKQSAARVKEASRSLTPQELFERGLPYMADRYGPVNLS